MFRIIEQYTKEKSPWDVLSISLIHHFTLKLIYNIQLPLYTKSIHKTFESWRKYVNIHVVIFGSFVYTSQGQVVFNISLVVKTYYFSMIKSTLSTRHRDHAILLIDRFRSVFVDYGEQIVIIHLRSTYNILI